jgi:MFS family permease
MTQQIRVAATDMYPPSQRGLGTGYILMGSLLGAVIAPGIIALAQDLSPRLAIDPLGLPWLFLPLLIVPALFLVLSLRPDPREIGRTLPAFYPGLKFSPQLNIAANPGMTLRKLFAFYPTLTAIVVSMASQGNMQMIMYVTSLALKEHGHSLAAISSSVSIHVVGMFAFTVPLGKLADKIGRKIVLLAGVVMAAVGSMLIPSSPSFLVITSGTFLVGLGWSAVFVAATALIADVCPPEIRGRAIGINDTISFIPGIILPLVAGPLVAAAGLWAVGWLGMLLMVPAFLFLLWLGEPQPGKYLSRARLVGIPSRQKPE